MTRLLIFDIISAAIAFSSWRSLRNPRSHGFFRFFAFECILGLFLLNVGYWFHEAFSAVHVISWLLLIVSLIMVVYGFYLLRTESKPRSGIENTTTLVTRGIYKYIHHPLYSSLLLFGWGVLLKNLSFLSVCLAVVTSAFLVVTARVEDTENIQKLGTEYGNYMKTTKMFIPFLI